MSTPSTGRPERAAAHQVSRIAPFRWHIISKIAPSLGWEWEQRSSTVDVFGKNGQLLEVSWDLDAVNGFSSSDGYRVTRREKFKLEKLCRALGADIKDGQVFQNLPYGHPARIDSLPALKRQAIVGLKILEASPDRLVGSNEESAKAAELNDDLPEAPSRDDARPPTAKSSNAIQAIEQLPEGTQEEEAAELGKISSRAAVQREAHLRNRFETYLKNSYQHEVGYYEIPTLTTVIYSDTVDFTANILYEAKGTADRMAVRLAMGQVLDYGRYIHGAQLALLLPEAPAIDMISLLELFGIGCVVENDAGNFKDLTSLRRCP